MSSAPDCADDCGCHGTDDGRVWFASMRVFLRALRYRIARAYDNWNAPLR